MTSTKDRILEALPATMRQLESRLELPFNTVRVSLQRLESESKAHRAESVPGSNRKSYMWRPGPAPDPKQAPAKIDVGAGFRGDPLLNALFGGKQSE